MAYKTIVSAEDWYWITYEQGDENKPVPSRIAVWALRDDDKTIGLMNVKGVGLVKGVLGLEALVEPPDVTGAYKHLSQFTPIELEKLKIFRAP